MRIWFHKVGQEVVLIRNRKEPKTTKPHSRVKTHRSDTQVPLTSKVPRLPPTDNLNKHPDEAYGDTEIQPRGKHLDNLKAGTK